MRTSASACGAVHQQRADRDPASARPGADRGGGPEELGLQDPDLWKDSFCAYVSGIDTYGPVTTRSRSDVNILAIVNTETKTVLLISTPRDYYVPFNFQPVNGAMDKLTHAGIYGIEGSMQALGDYYGFPIQYYMRVNFTGFIDVIDSLGGVDVESDADFGRWVLVPEGHEPSERRSGAGLSCATATPSEKGTGPAAVTRWR